MNYPHSTTGTFGVLFRFLWIIGLCLGTSIAQAGSVQFNYTTPSAGTTSAGVFASDGTLLRTLWSNEPTPAGSNTAIWNGLDDEGIPMSPGTYNIKILHSNVTYTWEGVLGNTSTDISGNPAKTGTTIRRSFKPIADLAISGSDMFFANGYNENKSLFDRSVTSQPNAVSYYGPDIESSRSLNHIASDSSRFYIAQCGNNLNTASFVSAFTTSTNVQYQFSSGVDEATGSVDWIKVIDLSYADKYGVNVGDPLTKELNDAAVKTLSVAGRSDVIGLTGFEKAPTGIAVQPGSTFLFASHGSVPRPAAYIQPTAYLNEIRVFNKTTGALVSTYTNSNLKQPGRIVADNTGLWVIAKDSSLNPIVRRYTVNPTTGVLSPVAGSDITGLYAPVALALSPDFSTLLVADSGTFATANNSQQVKAYTVSSGTPVAAWTLGVAGGYNTTNGSAAANNKFHFFRPGSVRSALPSGTDTAALVPSACLAFQSDGSFWVGDPGNERLQHFDASRTYVNNIMFLSSTYQASICNGDPTRVFAGWLEFSVNYSATDLQHGWTFVKNWSPGLTSEEAAGGTSFKPGFGTVVTLGGRVYGTSNQKLYDIQSSGTTRYAVTLPSSPSNVLHEDGSLRYATTTSSVASYFKKTFASLDGSNNPTWGAATQIATSPIPASGPKTNTGGRGAMGFKHPTTTSGLLVFSDGSDSRFHLGAVAQNGTTLSPFKWRSAPSGRYFDTHGTIGTNGDYPCNNAFVLGNNIILGAHGEGASDISGRVYQANQFLHYSDNGLMIGQFGSPINYRNIESYSNSNGLPPGVNTGRAGNAFAISMASVGANLYVYHNDESQSSGIHRWKISNPTSVSVLAPPNAPATVTLPAGSNGIGLTAQYFTGVNFDTLSATGRVASVDINWPATPPIPELPADNFSIRYSGLIEPKYTENYTFTVLRGANDKVRLWVNETLVADGWATTGTLTSSAVSLTAGTKARVLLEYSETNGDTLVSLKWQSTNQALQVIPYTQLYPSDARSFNFGVVDVVPADNNSIGRFEPQPVVLGSNGRSTASAINLSGVPFDTPPQSIYQTARITTFGFGLIELEPYAQYRVRLHLAELSFNAAGARVFHATVPDAVYLGTTNPSGAGVADMIIKPNIDIFALAGAKNKAVTVDYIVSTDNAGQLRLGSANVTNYPSLNGIEITRDPSDVPSFTPIGNGTGLKGEYYDGDFTTLVTTRADKDVNFEWTTTNLPPVSGSTNTNYTVRWSGKVLTTKAGNYRFQIGTGDASNIKLTVNGSTVINTWTTAASNPNTADIPLAASTQYDIVLEYKQVTGLSNVSLKWKIPSGTSQYTLIPRSQLYTTYSTPSTPVDMIVDNTDAGVTVAGTWGTGSASPKQGTNYFHDNATNKGTLQSVTYVPNLPEAGMYEVKTLWVGGSTRANNVPFIVTDSTGPHTVVVDQTQVLAAGTWISLGTFSFNAGTAGSVSIQNTGTASGKYVMADAVRFVK